MSDPIRDALTNLETSIAAQIKTVRSVLDQAMPTTAPDAMRRVTSGANLQTVIDLLPPSVTELRLEPGTWAGNLALGPGRARALTIRPDVDDTLLPAHGTRRQLLPVQLVMQDAFAPTLSTLPGAAFYTFMGVEFLGNEAEPGRTIIEIGGHRIAKIEDQPRSITFDRCSVHGGKRGGKRGILLNGADMTVLDTDVRNFVYQGEQSQAIATLSGEGPFWLEGLYLEGSGENYLAGGGDPVIEALIPSGITLRQCHLFKPPAWKALRGSSANLFELKNARNVLLEECLLENSWPDIQSGNGITLTTRNQDNTAPWSTVTNVRIRYTITRNIEGFWLQQLAQDDTNPSVAGKDLLMQHNLAQNVWNGISARRGHQPSTFDHNTILGVKGNLLSLAQTPVPYPAGALTFTNNVGAGGLYGVHQDNGGSGTPALMAGAPGGRFAGNVIEGNLERSIAYPPFNTVRAAGAFAQLIDKDGRYLGPEVGTDLVRPGANVDELKRRMPWAFA